MCIFSKKILFRKNIFEKWDQLHDYHLEKWIANDWTSPFSLRFGSHIISHTHIVNGTKNEKVRKEKEKKII